MEKFPMLQLYRTLLSISGYLIMGAGILLGITTANSPYYGFQLQTFLLSAFGGFILGGSIIVMAESIQVILSIENHLDRANRNQDTEQSLLREIASQLRDIRDSGMVNETTSSAVTTGSSGVVSGTPRPMVSKEDPRTLSERLASMPPFDPIS